MVAIAKLEKFGGELVAHGFAAPNEFGFGAFDEDFGGAGAGVVVGGEAHAVGSSVEESYEVTGFDCSDSAVAGEEVAGFADGAYDVGGDGFSAGLADGDDLVVRVVERGTDEVVHRGVGDDEGFSAVLFDDEDAGEERSCLRDEEAAGLEEEMGLFVGEAFGESCGIALDLVCCVKGSVGIVDAEAATGVDGANVVAVATKLGDECGDAFECSGEGIDLADLRADVDGDAVGLEPFGFGGAAVDGAGCLDVDAELVLGEACGDVGVGFGEDVWVDAESEAGADSEGFGTCGEEVELHLGLDIELEDAGFEGGVDLPRLLADAGEDDFFERRLVRFAHALELAAGDDVEACTLFAEQAQDGERGIGFNGVADGVWARGEGLLEELEAIGDLLRRVDVERRCILGGECREADRIAMKRAVAIGEGACIDGGCLLLCGGLLQNAVALFQLPLVGRA